MQNDRFAKGQSVTGVSRYAGTRYRVLTAHRDGSYTVRAMYGLDQDGRDMPGYLGFKYHVSGDVLRPIEQVPA